MEFPADKAKEAHAYFDLVAAGNAYEELYLVRSHDPKKDCWIIYVTKPETGKYIFIHRDLKKEK